MDVKTGLIFDLRDLPSEGVLLRGEISFGDLDIADEERLVFPYPARYELQLLMVAECMLVRGRVDFTLRGQCDRCEEWAEQPVAVSDVCHRYENAVGQPLDLTEDIREDILLAFPQRFLCAETCPGFCLRCGQNLQTGQCVCEADDLAVASGADELPDPWRGLDGFRPVQD